MVIYKATNIINNKIYIGQTVQALEKRRKAHERAHRYKNSKDMIFAKAIKKYGKENFTWEIIDTASSLDELNQKEEYWISKLNSLAENGCGYNDKRGGNNHKHSERTKSKISKSQTGELNHAFGKTGNLNPTSKRVININTGKIYESANICSKEEGLSYSHICAVCRGDRATTGGFSFRYLNSNNEIIPPQKTTLQRVRRIKNVTTGDVFPNCKEAVKSVERTCASNLSNLLLKNNGVCYFRGCIWCYEDVEESIVNNFEIPTKQMPQEKQKIGVKNITTGVVYSSITEAAKSQNVKKYSYLSTLLKKGDGKCFWKNQHWEVI